MTDQGADFLFVIDTDQYAGNFEREMTAYLTGRVGDCGVGEEYAALFAKEQSKQTELFENVAFVADEHGCSRPATIWPNPRYANDGMGGHYRIDTLDQKKACAAYVKSVESIYGGYIKNTQGVLDQLLAGKTVSNWTIAGAKQEIARHQKEIDKAKKLKKVAAYHAYMSVGIWFETQPTAEQIAIMKERTDKFAAVKRAQATYEKDFKVNIEGFRLVKFEKKQSEQTI